MSFVEYLPRFRVVAWLVIQGFQAGDLALLDDAALARLTETVLDINQYGLSSPAQNH